MDTFSKKILLLMTIFIEILSLWLFVDHTFIWFENFIMKSGYVYTYKECWENYSHDLKTFFLCFTDNPKTLSQLSERHIKTYLKELSYKMSSSWEVHKVWIDIKSSKTLWQIARHDNFSQVKKQKSISFLFPSAISKGTANIHCVISYT